MVCASVIAVLSLCVPSTPALAQDDYVRMNRTIELLENGQQNLFFSIVCTTCDENQSIATPVLTDGFCYFAHSR